MTDNPFVLYLGCAAMFAWAVGSPILGATLGHVEHPNVLLSDLMSSEPQLYQAFGTIAFSLSCTASITVITKGARQMKHNYRLRSKSVDYGNGDDECGGISFYRICDLSIVFCHVALVLGMVMISTKYDSENSQMTFQHVTHVISATSLFAISMAFAATYFVLIIPICGKYQLESDDMLFRKRLASIGLFSTLVLSLLSRIACFWYPEVGNYFLLAGEILFAVCTGVAPLSFLGDFRVNQDMLAVPRVWETTPDKPTHRTVGARVIYVVGCACTAFVIIVAFPSSFVLQKSILDFTYFLHMLDTDMMTVRSATIVLCGVAFPHVFMLIAENTKFLRCQFPKGTPKNVIDQFTTSCDVFLFVICSFLAPSSLAVLSHQVPGIMFHSVCFYAAFFCTSSIYVFFLAPTITQYKLEWYADAEMKRYIMMIKVGVISIIGASAFLPLGVELYSALQFTLNCILGVASSLFVLSYIRWAAFADSVDPVFSTFGSSSSDLKAKTSVKAIEVQKKIN